jgi:hypothetical protein
MGNRLIWLLMLATAWLLWHRSLIVCAITAGILIVLCSVFALIGDAISPGYVCCGTTWTTAECGACHKDLNDTWDYLALGCLSSALFIVPSVVGIKLVLTFFRGPVR